MTPKDCAALAEMLKNPPLESLNISCRCCYIFIPSNTFVDCELDDACAKILKKGFEVPFFKLMAIGNLTTTMKKK
jgi:hypothetical protein